MVFKIRTSKKTQEFFEAIEASENLQPYALSKLAISLSLKSDEPMVESDFKADNNGLELNRQTITGEYDELYKCLIAMKENRHIDDDEYFQKYINKCHFLLTSPQPKFCLVYFSTENGLCKVFLKTVRQVRTDWWKRTKNDYLLRPLG